MKCKICSQKMEIIFSKEMLFKYNISYFRCSNCYFIQTEEPFWLDEAYSSGAISPLDVGIMSRNFLLVNRVERLIYKLFQNLNEFIGVDYGGGHGIFVRMMRDNGFNFYRQDLYAKNLYARYFDIIDLPISKKYNILTAFEVFEHLPNPIEEIKKMFNLADILIFSTELQPFNDPKDLKNWWYLASEAGQHVSFYNESTFYEIAKIFNANFYTDTKSLHILSKKPLTINPFLSVRSKKNILQRIVNKLNNRIKNNQNTQNILCKRESLTMIDFEFVKQKMKTNEN